MTAQDDERIPPTERTTVRRGASRAVYDRQVIHDILDEALICHVGFVDEGQPYVLPMNHVRIGERLYVHGSPLSRKFRCICAGHPVCITVTLLDGLVLAGSATGHTVNYRSVVVLAVGQEVRDPAEKRSALQALLEHVIPGRWDDVREPSLREIEATMVVSFPLDEMSAKVRTGLPQEPTKEDEAARVWAGVLPLSLCPGTPVPDPRLPPDISPPAYVKAYRRPGC